MFHAQIKGVDVGLPTHLRDIARAWNFGATVGS